MDHFCAICKSPFLMDVDDIETETVATSCGHVFHRDCVAQRATVPGATCYLCGASLREDNKFTKIFVTYDEDEHDQVLSRSVKSATASARAALEQEMRVEMRKLEERLQDLEEEHTFNQAHIERLDRQLTTIQSLCYLYEHRMKCIEHRGRKVRDIR
ncbi:hypothetical protein C8Q76DRAFT_623088 [Earliella scabrosa]|nr:hypothetical protein C8Q76DRAFT_623088 [Earliella scabrosa]